MNWLRYNVVEFWPGCGLNAGVFPDNNWTKQSVIGIVKYKLCKLLVTSAITKYLLAEIVIFQFWKLHKKEWTICPWFAQEVKFRLWKKTGQRQGWVCEWPVNFPVQLSQFHFFIPFCSAQNGKHISCSGMKPWIFLLTLDKENLINKYVLKN